jgi:hypothetical protein
MKNTSMLVIVLLTWALSGYADNAQKMECKKGEKILSLNLGKHLGAGPTFYGLQLSGASGTEGYTEFESILKSSEKCTDLRNYYRIESGDAFLCAGEFFLTKGIYGQVILTEGAVSVFKDTLAKDAGWSCSL